MTRAGALAVAVALSACGLDDRTVAVSRRCETAPPDGLLTDFSTSRLGRCFPPLCEGALDSARTASLGTAGVTGLFFPYRAPRDGTLALGLTGDLASVSDDQSALSVVMDAGVVDAAALPPLGGFAVRFDECVTLADFSRVSFSVAGNLGACNLRVAPQLIALDDDLPETCPLDACAGSPPVTVTAGVTTVALPAAGSGRVLAGLQWELGLPAPPATTCTADFTLDDLRLAP